jgi:hypothetical protein
MPSADEVKAKARQVRTRAREYADDQPLIVALGAAAIGAALGFLLPLTFRERKVLGPARERVNEKLETITDQLDEKMRAKTDEDTQRRDDW